MTRSLCRNIAFRLEQRHEDPIEKYVYNDQFKQEKKRFLELLKDIPTWGEIYSNNPWLAGLVHLHCTHRFFNYGLQAGNTTLRFRTMLQLYHFIRSHSKRMPSFQILQVCTYTYLLQS